MFPKLALAKDSNGYKGFCFFQLTNKINGIKSGKEDVVYILS